jgi:TldD protein
VSDLSVTDDLFFKRAGLDRPQVEGAVGEALHGADDGELFLEYRQSESLVFDDGRLKSAGFDTAQGFGLRAVSGETTGYSHASEISEAAIRRAAATVRSVLGAGGGTLAEPPQRTNRSLYGDDNPLPGVPFERKVALLSEMDAYARSKDSRVRQVTATLSGEWQAVQIIRPDGQRTADVRPLVRLNVMIVAAQGERMESGAFGSGGRVTYEGFLTPERWRAAVDEALRQALVNLESVPAPAGEMPVVLGPGWPGILRTRR